MNRVTYLSAASALSMLATLSACDDRSVFGHPNEDASTTRRGPAMVDIGTTNLASAGAYALLAKSGITDVTGSTISGGHIGVSPALASSMTGFVLVLDGSNQFATSPSVLAPWRVFAADYATPTPTNLTAAILSMQNAYTDVATRGGPEVINLMGGTLDGLTLAPGLYTWGTSVTIPGDLTLSGGRDDVWIFRISNDLDLGTMNEVILAGGADANHVFWQVAGAVTIHAGAHFEGNILGQTGITLQTGASLHGRALAQTLIALDDNEVTVP